MPEIEIDRDEHRRMVVSVSVIRSGRVDAGVFAMGVAMCRGWFRLLGGTR